MMKALKLSALAIVFAFFALFSGCKDDSDDNASPFVGSYTISNATLAEDISINVVGPAGPVPVPIPAGTDITTQIQNSLLSAVECSSASNAYVELRKNFSIYMSCAGQNEFNAGTWEEVNDSTLILNMNSTAIPSSPSGFVLTVEGIDKTETGLEGKTSVPLPKEMIAMMIPPPLVLDPATPAVINAVFYIDFVKK